MHTPLLAWRRFRYLRWALVLMLASIALYTSQHWNVAQPPNGGTWQGYVLGTLGALLIVWLTLLGARKRSYRSTMGTVEGWTSAHVYLGLSLIVIGTLHCAFQFGLNVHTLAYVLMCLVIVSGIYGLYSYMNLPVRVAADRLGEGADAELAELVQLDRQIRQVLDRSDANLQAMALSALDLTLLGGSRWGRLLGRDRSKVVPATGGAPVANAEQRVMIRELSSRIPNASKQAEAEVLHQLLALFGRRQVILRSLRRNAQRQALLKVWLRFHIPLTFALLAALFTHIIAVFIYW